MKKLAVLVCVVAGFGCTQAKVAVMCKGDETAPAITCTFHETEGTAKATACLDLSFKCKNGKKPTKHVCQDVSDGKSIDQSYPMTAFTDSAACDSIVAGSLGMDNLKIN